MRRIVGPGSTLVLLALLAVAAAAQAAGMTARLASPGWDGSTVPKTQVCKKFGGAGAYSPAFAVAGLPAGTVALILAFNDETYQPMNHGGHGIVQYAVRAGSASVTIPSFKAESDALPAGMRTVSAHKAQSFSGTGGAYLPPCSGGHGNSYSATITAVDTGGRELARTRISLGRF